MMPLPDNIIPFKTSTIDDYGRVWIGRGYAGHRVLCRFTDDKTQDTIEVLTSGRANIGRPYKGREVDIYILKKD